MKGLVKTNMKTEKTKRVGKPLICKAERNFLGFADKHMLLFAWVAITALALAIRWLLRDFVSKDAEEYLLPWYERIKTGGSAAMTKQVGNYNILYQFCIRLFTLLPIEALHAYKLFSTVFDLLLALLAMFITVKNEKENGLLKGVLVYAAVLLSPIVFLNSAAWAQCDSIYCFFCVFSIYMMFRDRPLASLILFGAALAFKLQAIFVLPFLLFAYFRKKSFSILCFLAVPATMILLSLPGLLMGRRFAEVFSIYFNQTSTYKMMALSYPSFWMLLRTVSLKEYYQQFHVIAVLLTVCLLGGYMALWSHKKVRLTLGNCFAMAFILAYTAVLFLPAMHERYGYVYEILALITAVWCFRSVLLLVPLHIVTCVTYGHYLFESGLKLFNLAVFNVLIYTAYVLLLHRHMLLKAAPDETAPER